MKANSWQFRTTLKHKPTLPTWQPSTRIPETPSGDRNWSHETITRVHVNIMWTIMKLWDVNYYIYKYIFTNKVQIKIPNDYKNTCSKLNLNKWQVTCNQNSESNLEIFKYHANYTNLETHACWLATRTNVKSFQHSISITLCTRLKLRT